MSQLPEDCFCAIKRDSSYQNKVGSVQSDYAHLIQSKVGSVKHKFRDVPIPAVPVGADLQLPKEAFRVRYQHMQKEHVAISSHKVGADYYNPGTSDLGVPYADLPFAGQVIAHGEFEHCGNA